MDPLIKNGAAQREVQARGLQVKFSISELIAPRPYNELALKLLQGGRS